MFGVFGKIQYNTNFYFLFFFGGERGKIYNSISENSSNIWSLKNLYLHFSFNLAIYIPEN